MFGVIILVCLLLLWTVIIPQLNRWFSIQDEVKRTRERIAVIKSNTLFLNNLDSQNLDTNLTVAVSAIPFEKDYAGILTAITQSAVRSGVALSDYSFAVGELTNIKKTKSEYVPLELTLKVDGSIANVKSFIKEIGEKLPLAELKQWQAEGESSTVIILFYHKQEPKIVLNDTVLLSPLSTQSITLLKKLSLWVVPPFDLTTGGESAETTQEFPF